MPFFVKQKGEAVVGLPLHRGCRVSVLAESRLVTDADYPNSHNHETLFTEVRVVQDIGNFAFHNPSRIFATTPLLEVENIVLLEVAVIETDFKGFLPFFNGTIVFREDF